MKKLVIGIDLGTTYSCASVLSEAGTVDISPNGEGDRTTPSVMLIDSKDNITIGKDAKTLISALLKSNISEVEKQLENGYYKADDESRAVVEVAKRFIGKDHIYEFGNHDFDPTFVSGSVLKKIKQDIETAFGRNIDSAVITVPANFNNSQRQETMNAAEMAGLNVEDIINEPTAAALAYSMSTQIDGIYAVYDFGGGTFDCSIVETIGEEVKILGFAGVKKLGGRDIDKKLLDLVYDKFRQKSSKELNAKQFDITDAERYKKNLSSLKEVEIFIDGVDIIITREEFNEIISTLISKSLLTFDNALEDANIEVDNIMDVILVGGSSRIPLIADRIKEKIGKKPKMFGNPDETVAKGAAIYAALKNKTALNINQKAAIAGLDVKEITNVSLGQRLLDSDDSHMNQIIIKKGSRIPAKRTKKSYINDRQMLYAIQYNTNPELRTTITEGLSDTEVSEDVENVWQKTVTCPKPSSSLIDSYGSNEEFFNASEIETTYKIDKNQVFEVSVKHVQTDTTLLNEKISMLDGSLSTVSSMVDEDLDDFEIK